MITRYIVLVGFAGGILSLLFEPHIPKARADETLIMKNVSYGKAYRSIEIHPGSAENEATYRDEIDRLIREARAEAEKDLRRNTEDFKSACKEFNGVYQPDPTCHNPRTIYTRGDPKTRLRVILDSGKTGTVEIATLTPVCKADFCQFPDPGRTIERNKFFDGVYHKKNVERENCAPFIGHKLNISGAGKQQFFVSPGSTGGNYEYDHAKIEARQNAIKNIRTGLGAMKSKCVFSESDNDLLSTWLLNQPNNSSLGTYHHDDYSKQGNPVLETCLIQKSNSTVPKAVRDNINQEVNVTVVCQVACEFKNNTCKPNKDGAGYILDRVSPPGSSGSDGSKSGSADH